MWALAAKDAAPWYPPTSAKRVPLKSVVIAWNLTSSYTREGLRKDLADIDFEPSSIAVCHGDVVGSCVMWFEEHWESNAVVVALDGTRGLLKGAADDTTVRMAKWKHDEHKWSCDDVPLWLTTASLVIYATTYV